MEPAEERALHEAVLRGDDSAWRVLFQDSLGPLTRFVRARVRGPGISLQDAVQETMLVAVRRIADFDPGRGSFVAWLQGIARGVVQNQRRTHARRTTEPLAQEPEDPRRADPALAECVQLALGELSDEHRAVLDARYRLRHSVREIAASIERSEKAVESLLGRARSAFRAAYDSLRNTEELQ